MPIELSNNGEESILRMLLGKTIELFCWFYL